MGPYYYLARMKILVSLTYRFEVFATAGTNFILMMASTFLWKAAYRGIDNVAGVSENRMITYALISVLIASFYDINVEFTLRERIRQGEIAIDFFRPVNLLLCYLAEDLGRSISSIFNKILPLAAIMVLFIQVPIPAGLSAGLLFLLSTVMSFMILWLVCAMIGVLCFWYVELGDVGTIKDGVIILLSGKLIPLWLFPESIRNVMQFLPFQYIYQTPLSIYIGQLPIQQTVCSMIIQFLWIVILTVFLCLIWGNARKCVLIQGG